MNNRGVTLITVIIMISVILILSAIFVSTSLESLEEAKKAERKTEIYQLHLAVMDRYTMYEKNQGNISLIGTLAKSKWTTASECLNEILSTVDFSELESGEKAKKIEKITNEIARDYDEYVMLVNSGDVTRLGVDKVSGATYIVDYYTGSVYGPIEE